MAKIRLINTRHDPFLAVEYHDIVCRRRNHCGCASSQSLNAANKPVIKKHPASFHVEAKGKSAWLDREVLFLQPVWDATKSGWLKVEDPDKEAEEAAAKAKADKAPQPAKAKAKASKAKAKANGDTE